MGAGSIAARSPFAVRGRAVPNTAVGSETLALTLSAAAVACLPLLVPSGPSNLAPVDLLMASAVGAVVVRAIAAGHPWRFPYAIPIGLFLLGGALGALAGPVPRAGVVALMQDFLLVAWCWALVNLCRSPRCTSVLLRTWAYSSIAWVTLLFVGLAMGSTALTGQTARNATRTSLTLLDPSVSANYYVVSIMIIWASGYPRRRGVRIAAYAMLVAAIVSTGSNSGLTSLVVGTIAAALVMLYRRFGIAPAISALALALLAGGLLASTVNVTAVQDRAGESRWSFVREGIGRSDLSVDQREALRRESMRLYTTGGLLGAGPVSTKPRLERELAPLVKEAHDDYFAALIERGALGLLGVVLLVFGVGLRGFAIAGKPGPTLAVLARPHALFGAVAGTLVAMSVYELLHVRHVWALFALVAALFLWSREWQHPVAS